MQGVKNQEYPVCEQSEFSTKDTSYYIQFATIIVFWRPFSLPRPSHMLIVGETFFF